MKKVVEASDAVALGVKLCRPVVIPMYPITPQTHIVEMLAEFIDNGELDSEMIHVESEHSAMSACIGAQATGVRTFTATSSQGLALMFETLFVASGLRLPIVMVCIDGYSLSHVHEAVNIPEQRDVDRFLPKYRPRYRLDTKKPITIGPISYPDTYMEFKK